MENFPKMFKIRQRINAPRVENIERRVNELLDQFEIQRTVKRGERIALTAGSRGIKDKPRVLKTIVERLKDWALSLSRSLYGKPWRSHGRGPDRGSPKLGITEASLGAPIVSSVEVEKSVRQNSERLSSSIRIF